MVAVGINYTQCNCRNAPGVFGIHKQRSVIGTFDRSCVRALRHTLVKPHGYDSLQMQVLHHVTAPYDGLFLTEPTIYPSYLSVSSQVLAIYRYVVVDSQLDGTYAYVHTCKV